MSNPFETNTEGPRYGNAYENTISSPPPTLGGIGNGSPALPPRNKPQQPVPTSPYGTQRMPSPSDYHQPPVITNNAWQESNKTLDEGRNAWSPSPQPQNAYQYTGTQYGNTSTTENAYSPQSASATLNEHSNKIETPMTVSDNDATYNNNSNKAGLPSKLRLLIRVILFIAGIGHLGFAAGASPYSGESVPFDSSACFYFLFAVAICSIIYSAYHIIFFFVRRFGKADKMKRTILILCDLLMALLWGIGIIVEIAKFNCPPGYYNGWCNFYNTSIFFGFISFVLYIVTLGWDVVGGCKNRKK